MHAFGVYLNGKKLCVAGVGEDGVLTAIVDWVSKRGRPDMSLHVGGLFGSMKEHVHWVTRKPLRVGDRVQIRVMESRSVDKPSKRYKTDPAEELRSKKRYVRMMAKELGWKIRVRP